jgi:hypothetical protein
MEVYITLHNGARPYVVAVCDKKVKVYPTDSYEREVAFESEIESVFVGKSIDNNMTLYSGAGAGYEGNTILLKLPSSEAENKYVHISDVIYEFTSYAKIVEYYSPIGNNMVPYPYAIDELGNYYLMVEKVVLEPNAELTELIKEDEGDPYEYYYKNQTNYLELNVTNTF